ncbi:hypothetical protein CapIbe_001534 [Capra ibex]
MLTALRNYKTAFLSGFLLLKPSGQWYQGEPDSTGTGTVNNDINWDPPDNGRGHINSLIMCTISHFKITQGK